LSTRWVDIKNVHKRTKEKKKLNTGHHQMKLARRLGLPATT
jgi:hypothetical protein